MEKNKYLLTMMVAKRAKQLIAGAKPLVKTEHKNPVAIAMEEMKAGKIFLKEPSDLKKNPLDLILNLEVEDAREVVKKLKGGDTIAKISST